MANFISKDSHKTLIRFDILQGLNSGQLNFVGSNLKWFSGFDDPHSKLFYAVKLRDLIIQNISFPDEWMEFPSAYIEDEPAVFLKKDRFIRMID